MSSETSGTAGTERRFYCASLPTVPGEVTLAPDVAQHVRVLRMSVGDALVLFDAAGREAEATLIDLGPPPRCRVDGLRERTMPPDAPELHLVLAMPRASKLEDILRPVTELGVHEIHLVDTERSVGVLPAAKREAKLTRWEKLVLDATRQSERVRPPIVHPPAPLLEVAARADRESGRLVYAARRPGPLPDHLPRRSYVCVGPEGGFTDAELDGLEAIGYAPVRVGQTVLRMETAAIAGVAWALDRQRASR